MMQKKISNSKYIYSVAKTTLTLQCDTTRDCASRSFPLRASEDMLQYATKITVKSISLCHSYFMCHDTRFTPLHLKLFMYNTCQLVQQACSICIENRISTLITA